MSDPGPKRKVSFWEFYLSHFLQEHQHPMNIALHVIGTVGSLAFVPAVVLLKGSLWLLPLYPVVHVGPGLVGHKLFEPNKRVGDVRVFRTDFPGYWFVFANHVMTFQLLTGRFKPYSSRAGKPMD